MRDSLIIKLIAQQVYSSEPVQVVSEIPCRVFTAAVWCVPFFERYRWFIQ